MNNHAPTATQIEIVPQYPRAAFVPSSTGFCSFIRSSNSSPSSNGSVCLTILAEICGLLLVPGLPNYSIHTTLSHQSSRHQSSIRNLKASTIHFSVTSPPELHFILRCTYSSDTRTSSSKFEGGGSTPVLNMPSPLLHQKPIVSSSTQTLPAMPPGISARSSGRSLRRYSVAGPRTSPPGNPPCAVARWHIKGPALSAAFRMRTKGLVLHLFCSHIKIRSLLSDGFLASSPPFYFWIRCLEPGKPNGRCLPNF